MLIKNQSFYNKLPINPNYIKVDNGDIETRKRYSIVLDIADTIYITNYFLGYFSPSNNASELMRFQKESDLKWRNLWANWKNPFQETGVIDGDNFGVNVYFAGTPNDSRKRKPDYEKLIYLTSSAMNFGGWQCADFVITLKASHNGIKFIKEETEIPHDEFILGFLRCDSGILNNKPIQQFLGQTKLNPEFVNAHIMNAKGILPTAQFGRFFRGGKLLTLISQSNEIRDFFNERYKRNVVLWYTTSLYGTTKDLCQYDQLDRYVKFIGKTESKHCMRMQNPHFGNIKDWLDRRGIHSSKFTFQGSSKADRSFREMCSYIKYCLLMNQKDKTVKALKNQFEKQIDDLQDITEQKRCYVSTYGLDNWDDNLINPERVVKEENNLENLFKYWKKKVFKKKDWGMRKHKDLLNNPVTLRYELQDQI